MEIKILRLTTDEGPTLGSLYVDGELECFTLEDAYHKEKVMGETRIPSGTYEVHVKTWGGFHVRYTKKFNYHQGMLWIKDVPEFSHVLIHIGNFDEDTEGCLLVGQGAGVGGRRSITNSTDAYEDLYKKVIEAALDKDLHITFASRL